MSSKNESATDISEVNRPILSSIGSQGSTVICAETAQKQVGAGVTAMSRQIAVDVNDVSGLDKEQLAKKTRVCQQ